MKSSKNFVSAEEKFSQCCIQCLQFIHIIRSCLQLIVEDCFILNGGKQDLKLQFRSVLSRQNFFFFFSICGIAPVLLNQMFAFIGAIEAFKNACGGAFFSKVISNSPKILLKMSSFTYIYFQRFQTIDSTLLLYRTTIFKSGIYLLKFNSRNTRTRCAICSKLTIKTPERRHLASFWCLYC